MVNVSVRAKVLMYGCDALMTQALGCKGVECIEVGASRKQWRRIFDMPWWRSNKEQEDGPVFVPPRPNEPPVTTHRDCILAPQINTSLSSTLWPHSCARRKTSQEAAHLKIDPHQARLTVEFLVNGLPWKENALCCYE